MRDEFWGYIPLNQNSFKQLWKEADFFLDANILLDLYRYSSQSRAKSFELFASVQKRVYISEIALREFFKHHQSIYYDNKNIKSLVCADIKLDAIREKLSNRRHSLYDKDHALKLVDKFENELISYLESIEEKLESNGDTTLERIIDLLEFNIIKGFNPEEIEKKYKEGQKRFESRIPPGYKDDKKEGNEKYNDFLNWEIMIKYALDNNKNIIFVSEDLKEDWITRIHGKDIGPREDLLNEFYRRTNGKMIYIYNTYGFIENYNKHIKASNTDELLKEIQDIEKVEGIRLAGLKLQKFKDIQEEFNLDDESVIQSMQSDYSEQLRFINYLNDEKHKLIEIYQKESDNMTNKSIIGFEEKLRGLDRMISEQEERMVETRTILNSLKFSRIMRNKKAHDNY